MNLEQFLKLFTPLPGNHYLQVCSCENEITNELRKLMQGVDGELNLVIYNEEHLDYSQPFRAMPRDHDIVILQDIFSKHENPNMLLKITYTTLANTADIIIMEKKGTLDIEEIKILLEKFEFRAPNEIDIVDGYDLIMAKKMHMWGNGL